LATNRHPNLCKVLLIFFKLPIFFPECKVFINLMVVQRHVVEWKSNPICEIIMKYPTLEHNCKVFACSKSFAIIGLIMKEIFHFDLILGLKIIVTLDAAFFQRIIPHLCKVIHPKYNYKHSNEICTGTPLIGRFLGPRKNRLNRNPSY
jgi:hypothetical protein